MIEESLLSIVEDLAWLIEREENLPTLAFRGELSPLETEFFYEPPEGAKKASVPGIPVSDQPDAMPASRRTDHFEPSVPDSGTAGLPSRLAENVKCTLCHDRLFPFKEFRKKGEGKILVLHYSGSIQGTRPGRDTTGKTIFSTPEEDDLFSRMLGALGRKMDDAHFQQYPACIFDPSRSLAEDWNDRCRNCLNHVERTIEREGIRLILLTGPAAIFLLGEEMAKKASVSGEIIPLQFEGKEIPGIVVRSPAALLAYERKRKGLKAEGDPEGQSPAYKKTVQEEKQIKNQVLASLKAAFAYLD